jgi:pyrimidine operon attenuation protein/uracil phosphoribosyltransferase
MGKIMEFSGFVEWAFLGVVTGGVYILWQMKESLSQLNTELKVILVKQEHQRDMLDIHGEKLKEHDEKIDEHGKRLFKIEIQ